MPSDNEIAKAKITVEADVSGVKAAISDAKSEVGSMADDIEESAARGAGAFDSMGSKIDSSTAGVRKFSGAISGAVGAVTSLLGVLGVLISVLTTLIALLKRKSERLKELRKNYKSIQDQIDDFSVGNALDEFEKFEHQINRQIDDLVKEGKIRKEAAETLRAQAQAAADLRREQEKQEESAKRGALRQQQQLADAKLYTAAIKELQGIIEQQEISLLPSDDQLQADAERQKKILQDAFSGFLLPDGLIEQALANVDRITQKQLEAERERQRIADEAQRQREAEADRRSQERAQREVETIRQGLRSITAGEFTTVLQSMPRILQEVATKLGRLK